MKELEILTGIWAEVKNAREALMNAQNTIAQALAKLEAMEMGPAAVLPLAELQRYGNGWYEYETIGDEEEPAEIKVCPCVYLNGWVFLEDGNFDSPATLKQFYGRKGNMRVWNKEPTKVERKRWRWSE